MKVPFGWLKDFVDIDVDARMLGDKLVSAGFEIEQYIELRDNIKNVVVGKVAEIEKLADSDHLNVCKVDTGKSVLQIVTGAQNVRRGDLVPVALDGAVLPDGKKIHSGELRGTASYGMLCSGEELGLTEDDYKGAGVYGILILDPKEKIGEDINDVIGNTDVVLDVAVTANRPDCNSVLGMAREVAAVLGKELKFPDLSFATFGGDVSDFVEVDNENYGLCPRYMAAAVKDVVIVKSPKIMRDRLKAVGIRPINNLVDVTNYVLTEIGQPMHAFDRDNLAGHKIIVRNALKGEKIVALDGNEYSLNPEQLVICDAEKPVAVAGVMGGEYSSILPKTQTVILESARFARDSIRHTARDLNLHSDSSARYEKGIDFYSQEIGLRRALSLFSKYGWGKIANGFIDKRSEKIEKRILKYDYRAIEKIIGAELGKKPIIDILNRLDIQTSAEGDTLTSVIPLYREDIDGVNDLTEEVIRIYGYDVVKPRLFSNMRGGRSDTQLRMEKIRNTMVGKGAFETMSYAFITPKAFDTLNLRTDSPLRKTVDLRNPIGADMSVMRTTLAYSMLKTIESNYRRDNKEGRFFEIGNTYIPKQLPLTNLPEEKEKLVMGFYGGHEDYYAIKSVVDDLAEMLGIEIFYSRADIEYLHPGRSAVVKTSDGKILGYVGEVHPDVAKNLDVDERIYIAELDAAYLAEKGTDIKPYRPVSKYQGVSRDIALVAPCELTAAEILSSIKAACSDILEDAFVFDVYAGGQIPKGKKSIAVTLMFRKLDRTLKDEEVNDEIKQILGNLSASGTVLR
jgi:phenylalanyl-tRNA synthetase beta chain